MSDYISREEAIQAYEDSLHGKGSVYGLIEKIPCADVRENIHGEWIYDGDQIICSKCRTAFNFISLKTATKFCAECGADMRGKAE